MYLQQSEPFRSTLKYHLKIVGLAYLWCIMIYDDTLKLHFKSVS